MLTQKQMRDAINLSMMTAEGIENSDEKKKMEMAIEKAKIIVKSIDPEDMKIFKENEEAREFYSKEGIKNLYAAICCQAVHDYKHARKCIANPRLTRKEKEPIQLDIDKLESFFGSDFFKHNTGIYEKEKTIALIEENMKRDAARRQKEAMIN